MKNIANLLVFLVAAIHVAFLVLEMFYFDDPVGRNIFGTTPEESATMAVLAANQGLYNGFLAAGLFWGLFAGKTDVVFFFLGCVIVAGVYGAATASGTILIVQALPAALALGAMLLARRQN
jgi:putative membrane protein